MFTSEKLDSKDFLERLKTGNLNPESIIFGKVKKSEKDDEVLFAFKGDKGKIYPKRMSWRDIIVANPFPL